ncbi:MAG: SpoIID/LytB domain-containing protein [Bacteroidales bacterium]|nr:SpoIID/LytB domain-containing protein [Bacteroidales bacterium]
MLNKFQSEPSVRVGILTVAELRFDLNGAYRLGPVRLSGSCLARIADDGRIAVISPDGHVVIDSLPTFESLDSNATFTLHDVVIGVGFHWQRREDQTFAGSLELRPAPNGGITAINIVHVEDYLKSVISSEMSATASPALLKAHAVISRSWLLAQIDKQRRIADHGEKYSACTRTDDQLIRWYDREDHTDFHVCADDHCQRYQGLTRQTTQAVNEAVEATRGEVLAYDGELCDARFSKCCGGVFEEFENCWEPRHLHYLSARRDSTDETDFPDLHVEDRASQWITSRPDAFCNTADKSILSQVLNNYDQETTDFYRWTVTYTQDQLAALVAERSGIDFGAIRALEPVERGTSGRLVRLRIVGTHRTMIIGKELEIRRTLSPSHLYSSAFIVETGDADPVTGLPGTFTLRGAGWGHGVGLCQIGAAVMGARGYDYRSILAHYFVDADITRLYE